MDGFKIYVECTRLKDNTAPEQYPIYDKLTDYCEEDKWKMISLLLSSLFLT